MHPWELLGTATTPEGTEMALTLRGGEFVIHAGGKTLMSSRMKGSEQELARLGCAELGPDPVVLVGGLGMGFTLRATLDVVPPDAIVIVAELVPAVVAWNRGPLARLHDHALADPRVQVALGDVNHLLRSSNARFDAILLDVDNGPRAFTQGGNAHLYDDAGVTTVRDALKPGGTVAVWSAWDDRKFEHRLRHHGFRAQSHRVRARLKQGGPEHTIFLGTRPG
jgi:spermidine synthase